MASGELWPHQAEAVEAITRAIGSGGRTTLIAACGTGKTRIGRAAVARLDTVRRVLVVLPTIELLVQTLRAYRDAGDGPLGTVVALCSDPSVAELELLHGEPDVLVTTASEVLAECVRGEECATVLSTYASLPVLADAHSRHGLPDWDQVVIDEAHRTTGRADGPWKAVHRDELVPARRRLYMTATPRISDHGGESVSMQDTTIFGQVSYRLPFSKAIEMGLLADYRVVVPVVTDEEVHRLAADETLAVTLGGAKLSPGMLAGQIAVLRAMREFGARRAISYHHRVAEAKKWAQTLPAAAALLPGSIDLWAGHVSGMQAPHLRRRVIERLADPDGDMVMVSNAKVLAEGVDVPAVDAVVFTRPRDSAVDTVQAVGRALRTGGRSEKVATIVVPLLLSAGESPEAALEGSAWEPVWQVIRALRDHDDRLEEYLRIKRAELGEGRLFEGGPREARLPPWLHVLGVDMPADFAQAITIRALRASSPSWDEYFGAARAYAYLHGHANTPGKWVSPGGLRVGQWILDQRKARREGRLSREREDALQTLHIVWNVIDDVWATALGHAQKFHAQHGHLNVRQDERTEDGYGLGQWIGWQRMAYRQGKLPDERIAALDQLGMIWDKALTAWQRNYTEAQQYFAEHGDLLVPNSHTTPSGCSLGSWVGRQREHHEAGKLSAEQIVLLDAIGMAWRPLDEAWQQAYQYACAYRERHGHLDVPSAYVGSDAFRLGTWIGNQRKARREDRLSADKIRALEDLGIVWDPLEAKWERGLAEARSYKDRYKDLRVHAKYESPSGYKLGGWIADQRKARAQGRLAQHRVEKLDAIGMAWAVPDDTWKVAYRDLRSYREENGHLDLPQDFISTSGINLYSWAATQRTVRASGKLSEERQRLLDGIDFPWDLERDRWMRRYHEVSAAMGEAKSPRSLPAGSPERVWLDNQAVGYRKNRLDPERRELLEALGVTADQLWTIWRSAYDELVAFHKEEGHFQVPAEYRTIDGTFLAAWKNVQRTQRNQGKLPQERIRLLDKIGFPWDPYAEHWDNRYNEAVAFKERNGHLRPPRGSRLDKWLVRQHRNHERGILNRTHLGLLDRLDAQWFAAATDTGAPSPEQWGGYRRESTLTDSA
ncbi:Helicase associated domain protein [Streptomyces sp. NPDC006265]|uniref:DEAD/DEAH box helicase n=1 Tax=Streptomyces sp. NPDC006265 TaxID=3156740 RepID=UPI0033AA36EF